MRTFGAAFAAAIAATDGEGFRPLVHIDNVEDTADVFLSTFAFTWAGDSTVYAGHLIEIGPLYDTADGAGDLRLIMFDNAANRAACILGATVEVYLLANPVETGTPGTWSGDRELLWRGMLSDPLEVGAGRIVADAVSFDGSRHARLIGRVLSETDHAGIDPREIGTVAPIIVGAMKRTRCVGIDLGTVTTLATAIDASQTTGIELSDVTRLPTSGTVQIDEEQITYTGLSGAVLTGAARGAASTTMAAHEAGAPVAELQSSYLWLIADHPVKRVSDVYVEGTRQVSAETSTLSGNITDAATSLTVASTLTFPAMGTLVIDSEEMHYSGASGGNVTGLSRGENGTAAAAHTSGATVEAREWQVDIDNTGRATLAFFAPLLLARLPTIEFDVSDTIDITDPTHSHTGATGSMTSTAGTEGLSNPSPSTAWIDESKCCDHNNTTYMRTLVSAGQARAQGSINMTLSGNTTGNTPLNATLRVRAAVDDLGGSQSAGSFNFGNSKWTWAGTVFRKTTAQIAAGEYIEVSANKSVSTWASLQTLATDIIGPGWSSGGVQDKARVYDINFTTINYQSSPSQQASTGISKTGTVTVDGAVADVVVGRDVRVDVEGAADDGNGTISGTGGLLLTRPDHAVAWMLDRYGELSAAEASAQSLEAITDVDLAFELRERIGLRDVLAEIARHARAVLIYSGGGYVLRRRVVALTETIFDNPDMTLADATIVRADGGESSLSFGLVGLRDLVNELTYRYGRHGDGEWTAVELLDDATSIAAWGSRPATLDLPWVHDATDADEIAQWHADRSVTAHRRKVIRVRATLAALALEPGDVVRVTSTPMSVDTLGEVVACGPKGVSSATVGVGLVIEEYPGIDPLWY